MHALIRQHVEALHRHLVVVLDRKELSRLDEILDLATVEAEVRQLVERTLVEVEFVATGPVDEVLPYLAARFASQVVVWEEQVHTGLEGVVDAGDAFRCQEENSLVVLSCHWH